LENPDKGGTAQVCTVERQRDRTPFYISDTDTDTGAVVHTRSSQPRRPVRRKRSNIHRRNQEHYLKGRRRDWMVKCLAWNCRPTQTREHTHTMERNCNAGKVVVRDRKTEILDLRMKERLEARIRRSSSSLEDSKAYYTHTLETLDTHQVLSQWNTYSKQETVNRLHMDKEMLVEEYLGIKRKIEILEEKLEFVRNLEEKEVRKGFTDYGVGDFSMDSKTAEKVNYFEREIRKMKIKNTKLQSHNLSIERRFVNKEDCNVSLEKSTSSSVD